MALINITRQSEDGLEQQVWYFSTHLPPGDNHNVVIVLNRYVRATRPTRRHGFKPVDTYDRTDSRGMTLQDAALVPLPEDAQQEAIASLTITVSKVLPR